MSIVATKLQERKTAFISLHELLETIVEQEGCTLQEAAQFLETVLHEGRGEGHCPPWYTHKPYLQLAHAIDGRKMDSLLADTARYGEYQKGIPF